MARRMLTCLEAKADWVAVKQRWFTFCDQLATATPDSLPDLKISQAIIKEKLDQLEQGISYIEKVPKRELLRQYQFELAALKPLMVEQDGGLGIVGNDEQFYPYPSFVSVYERIKKNQRYYDQLASRGMSRMLLVPFRLPFVRLADHYAVTLLGQRPHRFSAYDDYEEQFQFEPHGFGENDFTGWTYEAETNFSMFPGWQFIFVNPRASIDATDISQEARDSGLVLGDYSGESAIKLWPQEQSFMTPNQWYTQAIVTYRETGELLDNRGAGTGCLTLGVYYTHTQIETHVVSIRWFGEVNAPGFHFYKSDDLTSSKLAIRTVG